MEMADGPSEMPMGSSSPDDSGIQILLTGRRFSGKSSSGNTILGRRKFKVHVQHQKHKDGDEFGVICDAVTQIDGKQVAVIDCPDLLDPDLNKEKLEMMKEQLVSRCSAGLSAVLLVVPLVRNVENEEEMLDFMRHLLGCGVQKYIMILFTHGDELEDLDQTIEEHLKHKDHEDLQRLVTECGGKFHCFNNKRESDSQKQDLLQNIEKMMVENRGKFLMAQMRRRSSMDTPIVFGEKDSDEVDVIPGRKDLRLVLLGKTGVGKSATGNSIIGRNVFQSSASSISQTKHCHSETTVRIGKHISVIDTPGLYDTELSEEEIQTELLKCITYASPGPHAFIIVIKVGRFTEENKRTVENLKELFGEQIEKYTMIIFTHKDQLEEENKTIEQFLQESEPDLQSLIQSCGNRFFFLNNKSASFPQFKDLISEIEKMVAENGGHFRNEMFEGTEKCIREIQKQKLHEELEHSGFAEESRFEEQHLIKTHECIKVLVRWLRIIGDEMNAIKNFERELQRKGIDNIEPIIHAFRTTGKLAKQDKCVIQ